MNLLEDHFHLQRPPFPQTAQSAALFSHQGIKEALDRFRFAVARYAIALCCAQSGCGKSTLLSLFMQELDKTSHFCLYSSLSSLGPFSLLALLAQKLGLRPRRTKGETAQDLLAHLRGLSKHCVLLLDEAHLLPDPSLEDLRLLMGDSLDKSSPFALVLCGQPLLRERLLEPQHYALSQRVCVRVRLRPLTDSEVVLFLDKHLRACGAQRNLFEPDATTLLFQHSRGLPRLLQNLALSALLSAAAANKKTVDCDCVQQALLDLEAP